MGLHYYSEKLDTLTSNDLYLPMNEHQIKYYENIVTLSLCVKADD